MGSSLPVVTEARCWDLAVRRLVVCNHLGQQRDHRLDMPPAHGDTRDFADSLHCLPGVRWCSLHQSEYQHDVERAAVDTHCVRIDRLGWAIPGGLWHWLLAYVPSVTQPT